MTIPEKLNWVSARFHCSTRKVYEKLKDDVEQDVKERNSLRSPEDRYHFEFTNNTSSFLVFVERGRPDRFVKFRLEDHQIEIERGFASDTSVIVAKVTLNNEGRCVFKIEEKEHESWQLRKMVLEDLFFVGD